MHSSCDSSACWLNTVSCLEREADVLFINWTNSNSTHKPFSITFFNSFSPNFSFSFSSSFTFYFMLQLLSDNYMLSTCVAWRKRISTNLWLHSFGGMDYPSQSAFIKQAFVCVVTTRPVALWYSTLLCILCRCVCEIHKSIPWLCNTYRGRIPFTTRGLRRLQLLSYYALHTYLSKHTIESLSAKQWALNNKTKQTQTKLPGQTINVWHWMTVDDFWCWISLELLRGNHCRVVCWIVCWTIDWKYCSFIYLFPSQVGCNEHCPGLFPCCRNYLVS